MKEWFIRGCVIVSSVLLYVLFWYNTLKPIELTVGVYAGSYWGTSVGNMYQVLDKARDRICSSSSRRIFRFWLIPEHSIRWMIP